MGLACLQKFCNVVGEGLLVLCNGFGGGRWVRRWGIMSWVKVLYHVCGSCNGKFGEYIRRLYHVPWRLPAFQGVWGRQLGSFKKLWDNGRSF